MMPPPRDKAAISSGSTAARIPRWSISPPKKAARQLERLIAGADVLLQNLKPGSMDKLGFSIERLKKDYPALICCTITGYGDEGPYARPQGL